MLAQLDMAQPVLAVLQSSMKVSMVMRNFVSSVCVVLGSGRTEEWNFVTKVSGVLEEMVSRMHEEDFSG